MLLYGARRKRFYCRYQEQLLGSTVRHQETP